MFSGEPLFGVGEPFAGWPQPSVMAASAASRYPRWRYPTNPGTARNLVSACRWCSCASAVRPARPAATAAARCHSAAGPVATSSAGSSASATAVAPSSSVQTRAISGHRYQGGIGIRGRGRRWVMPARYCWTARSRSPASREARPRQVPQASPAVSGVGGGDPLGFVGRGGGLGPATRAGVRLPDQDPPPRLLPARADPAGLTQAPAGGGERGFGFEPDTVDGGDVEIDRGEQPGGADLQCGLPGPVQVVQFQVAELADGGQLVQRPGPPQRQPGPFRDGRGPPEPGRR